VNALCLYPRALRETMHKNGEISHIFWHTPEIPAIRGAEVGIESSRTAKQRYQNHVSKGQNKEHEHSEILCTHV
jgi:hypothetical protein